MEAKKNPNVNLEKKRRLFFQIGLISSLSLALLAFEWGVTGSTDDNPFKLTNATSELQEVEIQRTKAQEQPKQKVIVPAISMLDIVDDELDKLIDEFDVDGFDIEDLNGVDIFIPTIAIEDTLDVDPIVEVFTKIPEFPGGADALTEFLGEKPHLS